MDFTTLYFWVYIVNIMALFFIVSFSDYPRARYSVDRYQDVLSLVTNIGLLIWVCHLKGYL